MKTIVTNSDNVSVYLFEDSTVVSLEPNKISTSNFIINDLNLSNATMYENVNNPSDWVGGKYKFDGTTWTLNTNWVAPPEEETP